MTTVISRQHRHLVYLHLMDNYSRHYLAKNLSLELDDEEIKNYLREIKEMELEKIK